jgi:hypothetical protein
VQPSRCRNRRETASGGRRDAPPPSAEAIDEARAALGALARRHVPEGSCELEIVSRDFVVEAAGLVDPTPPARPVARWPLEAEARR